MVRQRVGVLEPHGRGRRPLRPDALSANAAAVGPAAPAVVVHTLAHAEGALRAAAEAGCTVCLVSAPDAGIYAGCGWWGALVAAARAAAPAARFAVLLDCGDEPGAALAAIRAEIEGVIFTGRADVARRLADLAGRHGVRLVAARPAAALDLVDDFFASADEIERRCADFLASARPPIAPRPP